MRYVYWLRSRQKRLLVVALTILLYCLLFFLDGQRSFLHLATTSFPFFDWLSFGFSATVALMFLAVGDLVWLYVRDRSVGSLLLCFSCAMMVTFIVETGATKNDPLLSAISASGSALALPFFAILLLVFPRNYFLALAQARERAGSDRRPRRRSYSVVLLYGYAIGIVVLAVPIALRAILFPLLQLQTPAWVETLDYFYSLFVLVSILVTILISYRQSATPRERQQARLFVSGVILAFVPLLLFTILPSLLHLPYVDGQISTITLALLPLILGYSIFRYQILVFDKDIRRTACWISGAISLALLGYGVFVVTDVFRPGNEIVRVICAISAMALLGPLVWWLARVLTERLFFSEVLHYRRLINDPRLIGNEMMDLNEVAHLFVVAAVNTFETAEVCLLVLDDDTGYCRICPPLSHDNPSEEARLRLLSYVKARVNPALAEKPGWLKAYDPVVERLAAARHPLLLSEILRTSDQKSPVFARYFTSGAVQTEFDPLLVAVRSQGRLVGILILGERGDHQPYAGPDFEAIHLILARFSPLLETARLYDQASRHTAILSTLYSVNTLPVKAIQTIEEVAVTYAQVVAKAADAVAEVWLYDEEENALRRVVHTESCDLLPSPSHLMALHEADWTTWFYEGDDSLFTHIRPSMHVPPCLPQTPCSPFAWLPLKRGQQRLGVLTLTYARPHNFLTEEKHVLEMFAGQCATALENAQITLQLRAAYEQQRELDRLKDQFIMTASHELRTPLTAVLGYIELLKEHNLRLSAEMRANFIGKAHRGCDELVLMVGNIMDASRVHIDAEHIQLEQVPLAESIVHVIEILEAVSRRENRIIRINIPTGLFVVADDLRLRQVLLNLVSNAFKYSPLGTAVEITCEIAAEDVAVHVRDYGLGVPKEAQPYLFERFMRLDRDMNSAVRGAGLGLYISKQLVTAMGGSLHITSSGIAGEGSTFTFVLKRAELSQTQGVSALTPPNRLVI